MITRRFFLQTGAIGLLAACQSTTNPTDMSQTPAVDTTAQPVSNTSGKRSENSIANVKVTDVIVEFAPAIARSKREFQHPREEVQSLVKEAMKRELSAANPGGSVEATAKVTIVSFSVANTGTALMGGNSSTIRAKTTLVDRTSGDQFGESVIVGGSSGMRPTVFGAIAIGTPEEEMILAAQSLGERTRKQIY